MSEIRPSGYSILKFFGGVADGRWIAVKDEMNAYRVPHVEKSLRWVSDEEPFVSIKTDDYTRRVVFSPERKRRESMVLCSISDDEFVKILNKVAK